MSWPSGIPAKECHPSHHITDSGWYASDPCCDHCGMSPIDHPLSITKPCGRPVTSAMWLGAEGSYL